MSLKLKNNVISSFNINTDMSILTISPISQEGESEFDKENFSLVLDFKFTDFAIDRAIFDPDTAADGENGLTGEGLGYKIQCIFQKRFQKANLVICRSFRTRSHVKSTFPYHCVDSLAVIASGL